MTLRASLGDARSSLGDAGRRILSILFWLAPDSGSARAVQIRCTASFPTALTALPRLISLSQMMMDPDGGVYSLHHFDGSWKQGLNNNNNMGARPTRATVAVSRATSMAVSRATSMRELR